MANVKLDFIHQGFPPSHLRMKSGIDIADNPTSPNNSPTVGENSPYKSSKYLTFEERLRTFGTRWPNPVVSAVDLAKAGFYYTNNLDIVRCAFCRIDIGEWVAGDVPMSEHAKWSPSCSFVRTNGMSEQTRTPLERSSSTTSTITSSTSTNTSSTTSSSTSSQNSGDVCGHYEFLPYSVSDNQDIDLLKKLGVQRHRRPAHPDYSLYENRLKTFINWPKSLKQKPAVLAEAGFYYLGVGDQTLCFHCGSGLKDWEENDDPWEQHAMWFPRCYHLLVTKGPEFVEKVQKSMLAPKEAEEVGPGTSNSNVCATTNKNETKEDTVKKENIATNDENGEKRNDRDLILCKICYKNDVGIVFLPCGHMLVCVDCATALKNCPMCRKPLEATVRAYLS